MIDYNSIEYLQEEYLNKYYGRNIAELERLKVEFVNEFRKLNKFFKKTVLKDVDSSCLFSQPDLCVFDILKRKLKSIKLGIKFSDYEGFPECKFYHKLDNLLYIGISSDSFIYTIDSKTGDLINEIKGYDYSKLRKLWVDYLVLSQELILVTYNFTDCLFKNRTIFTEGKVRDYIEQYGPK